MVELNQTSRRRSANAPRRRLWTAGRVAPYSQETQEALAEFIGGFAAMPQPVVLIFHGLLNGMTLDGIAAALHTTRTNARALIEKASREYWMVADVYRANGHLLEGKR